MLQGLAVAVVPLIKNTSVLLRKTTPGSGRRFHVGNSLSFTDEHSGRSPPGWRGTIDTGGSSNPRGVVSFE